MRNENTSSETLLAKGSAATSRKKNKHPADARNKKTTQQEAEAASPANESVGGEEDPGCALEFTVKKNHNLT